MNIIISQLPYLGCSVISMKDLPKEYGIEVFIEYGNDYFWHSVLKEILEEREGKFTIHGPFVGINFADINCDWEGIKKTYESAFQYCKEFKSEHCVCHPHGDIPITEGFEINAGKQIVIQRLLELNALAKKAGVELLIENMPYTHLLFDETEFITMLKPLNELSFLIDVGHAMIHNWDLNHVMTELGTRIKAYHIHENNLKEDQHLMVGEGNFDWKSFFECYKKNTPDAAIVLEYMNGTTEEILKNAELVKSFLK